MDERCEWSDLIKEHCAHCRGILTPEEEEKKRQDTIDAFVRSME